MTIENPEAYAAGQWDFGRYDCCFKRGIKLGDVDSIKGCDGEVVGRNTAMVEAGNGELLVTDFKDVGVRVKGAQSQAFAAFVTHDIPVLWVWGPTNVPQEYVLWTPKMKMVKDWKWRIILAREFDFDAAKKPCNEEAIRNIYRRWFEWVEGGGRWH